MIPRICANCGRPVGNEEGIVGVVCDKLPVALWKMPGETCGSFAMADNPPVAYPDEPLTAPQAGDGAFPAPGDGAGAENAAMTANDPANDESEEG